MIIGIDPSLHWFVARTGIGKWRQAHADLLRASVKAYLPMCRIERYNKRARCFRTFEYPLLPRYLFVGLPPAQLELGFSKVTAIDGVDHFIPTPPFAPLRIPHCEMEAIFSAEIDMQFDQTRAAKKYHGEKLDRAFPKGVHVQAKLDHLLSGYVGEVLGNNGKDEVFVDMRLGRVVFKPSDIMLAASAA